MLKKILQWDRDLFIYLNNLGVDDYDRFWLFITSISTWIPLFLLFIGLLFYKFGKREGLFKTVTIIVMVTFVLSLSALTKEWVARLRPNNDETVNTLIRILQSPNDFSFFSGHAASSFSITLLVVLFLKRRIKWAWFFFLWPLLFTSSRIFVGVHFPIDILVGIAVGLSSAWFFYKWHQRLLPRVVGR